MTRHLTLNDALVNKWNPIGKLTTEDDNSLSLTDLTRLQ